MREQTTSWRQTRVRGEEIEQGPVAEQLLLPARVDAAAEFSLRVEYKTLR